MRIRKVGCLFLGGSSCSYLEGTLAMRLLMVFPGAAGGVECFWAAEFVGWFLGMVALADVGRLINDIFVSLVRCGRLLGECPFVLGGGSHGALSAA